MLPTWTKTCSLPGQEKVPYLDKAGIIMSILSPQLSLQLGSRTWKGLTERYHLAVTDQMDHPVTIEMEQF